MYMKMIDGQLMDNGLLIIYTNTMFVYVIRLDCFRTMLNLTVLKI